MMSNLVATVTDEKWPYELLLQNTICSICNNQYYNNWFSCNRRQAMVNTHPGLLSLKRQHFYMVKLFAKYQIRSFSRNSNFNGQPGVKTELETYTIPNAALPKELQRKTFIRHGEFVKIYYIIIIIDFFRQ